MRAWGWARVACWQVSVTRKDGTLVDVHLDERAYFGEKALLTEEPRNATVRAPMAIMWCACVHMHTRDRMWPTAGWVPVHPSKRTHGDQTPVTFRQVAKFITAT